ncbi:alanine racemase [Micromonospora sp. C28SCA-DRY-2]|uniref:alanine racemase n=1 Tax=Micromonospora sp. C28SCA-DRY-2 TaxID=3059522 RepID=UPI0026753100|nr:alanine racemase [Micromonospora sp. C28SCA-DRY-2]MDO3703254.1 alanine racemase [Micromonospora sp. C28SCA-DRY-2]
MNVEPQIDWRTKGFWWPGPAVDAADFVAAGHHLFGGAFTWPTLVVRRTAIEHNIRTLADFCVRHGLAFAPHVKTTMAPSLIAAQVAAGAWGVTVATANQALAAHAMGQRRVVLASQVLDPAPLRWAAGEAQRGFELLFQVDSTTGVALAADALRTAPGDRPLRVLVELGYPGGRTGCRTLGDLADVAAAVDAAPRLDLAGIAAYEGGLPEPAEVAAFLDRVRVATRDLGRRGPLPAEVVVAAGGSAYFDIVAERLAGQWLPGHHLTTVLRSGAYVSHDDGFYRLRTPFRRVPDEGFLDAAVEVWAQVLSTPEAGLAIVGMGKRDVPCDEGPPEPAWVRRLDGTLVPARGLQVSRLNDHHGFVATDDVTPLRPGDLVGFGISHPCTAFDRWRTIPVVDEDRTVVDVLQTYF